MDQTQAPVVDALAAIVRDPVTGFGAPGHHQGAAMPSGMAKLLGKAVFRADVLTPKGLDDRTESLHAVQRAHEIAAEAWGADLCRYTTGGSTQSLHTLIASCAKPGDRDPDRGQCAQGRVRRRAVRRAGPGRGAARGG